MVLGKTITGMVQSIVAFLYPAYRSYKAIKTNEKDDDTELLIYWTVVGFFTFFESYANLPHFLWINIILPYLNKHEKEIDDQVKKGGKEAIKYGMKTLIKAKNLESKVKNEINHMKEESDKKDN
ncbi:receptor expression-enhancing protein [Anaeramoeba flamelloides]|uniref:Receptor expression-enhancing protein n=1 Tax=Anaeramoeba flamelloides TaxID=1746091 RepID=A0AAV7YU12_9EUKA|nr:receptor expression-enhancing protein [Anaeramoeba flamelloides]